MPTDEVPESESKKVTQRFMFDLKLSGFKLLFFCLKIDKKKFFRLKKKRRNSKFARVSEAFGNKTSDLVNEFVLRDSDFFKCALI